MNHIAQWRTRFPTSYCLLLLYHVSSVSWSFRCSKIGNDRVRDYSLRFTAKVRNPLPFRTDWTLKNWSWSRENRRSDHAPRFVNTRPKVGRRERVHRSFRACVCAWACCRPGRSNFYATRHQSTIGTALLITINAITCFRSAELIILNWSIPRDSHTRRLFSPESRSVKQSPIRSNGP